MISETKPAATATMTLDGVEMNFTEGETIYEVAQRADIEVPTLCYDPRLEAFGACRLCIVEIEGGRNPVASCTTPATSGMVVHTQTETIEKHRRTLLELVASENPEENIDPLRGFASQELNQLLEQHDVQPGRFR